MTASTTIALTKTGSTLSEEAGAALATSAELAGAGICSGEGGMLPEEQEANSRYFYELASAQFGYREELSSSTQALHFKGGQGAKTGTGGHLPGSKNVGKIAEVRGIELGHPAVSPPTFTNLHSVDDCRRFGDRVSELSGGDPVGMKLSANHVEADLRFALDYVILNGPRRWHRRRTDHAPRPHQRSDHYSPRRFLDDAGASGRVTLIATGGFFVPTDFIKALALGADGIALSNSAMQAIGCVGARMCNSNNCPTGIATQKLELRADSTSQHRPNASQRSSMHRLSSCQ